MQLKGRHGVSKKKKTMFSISSKVEAQARNKDAIMGNAVVYLSIFVA
jgi:hypothetical protein